MTATCLPPLPSTTAPRQRLPQGTVDCHAHVFDPAQAPRLAPGRSYTPAPVTLADYLAMCEAVGIARTVQVNASVYGLDNTPTLEVIRTLGPTRARGIASIKTDTDEAELRRLHEGGMRGVRLSTHVAGYGGVELVETIARRVAPLGWHAQVHFGHAQEIAEAEAMLARIPSPLVFDHLGCVRGGEGVASAGFQAMLRLLKQRDDRWVKVSSFYRRSDAGGPRYDDMKPLVQALVEARPDRVVWGSNWPHSAMSAPDAVPDDGPLVDLFFDWVPDAATRQRICVTNPEQLYGFGETTQ